MSMRLTVLALLFALASPGIAWSDPPAHAPAHGYRAKHKHKHKHEHDGAEVVFDSGRGIYVVVGMPDVFFHEGRYYRRHEGSWQVSVDGRGGWSFSASGSIPGVILKASDHSVPAKLAPR